MAFIWYIEGIKQQLPIVPKFLEKKINSISENEKIEQVKPNVDSLNKVKSKRKKITYYQNEKNKILAKHIMNEYVITLHIRDSIEEAWTLIKENRFRHIPVVDLNNKVIGIFSDRDLLAFDNKNKPLKDITVESVIQKEVITATEDTEISEIAKIFFNARIGAMPIVNEVESLIGIITRSDMLHVLVNHPNFEGWI